MPIKRLNTFEAICIIAFLLYSSNPCSNPCNIDTTDVKKIVANVIFNKFVILISLFKSTAILSEKINTINDIMNDIIVFISNRVPIIVPAIFLFFLRYKAAYLVNVTPIPAPANTMNV